MGKWIDFVVLMSVMGAFFANSKEMKKIAAILWIIKLEWKKEMIAFFLCGLFLTVPVLLITCFLAYGRIAKLPLKFKANKEDVVDAFFEEVIWRDVIIFFVLSDLKINEVDFSVVSLFYIALFVFMHDFNEKKEYIEIFLYSFILFGAAFFPGNSLWFTYWT